MTQQKRSTFTRRFLSVYVMVAMALILPNGNGLSTTQAQELPMESRSFVEWVEEFSLQGDEQVFIVDSAQTDTVTDLTPPPSVLGSQPYVTILCKFPEETATYPKSWFETMMGDQYPGMDHFWREVSYNNINLAGSTVTGWYDLPKTRNEYTNSGGDKNNDCMTLADADINFPDYVGINIILDKQFTVCCNITGGAGEVTLGFDGGGTYRITYTGTSEFTPRYVVGVLQHEMGHTFGLPHSSGPYTDIYDSGWDVMSGYASGLHCDWTIETCYQHPEYAYLGPHTIAYNKTIPGWIASNRIFQADVGTNSTITLERLAKPPAGNYLMAKVPILGSATEFYTVEARKFTGYDKFLQQRENSEGIVIHRVDTTRDINTGHADAMDSDQNGNTNDAGSVWIPGEVYIDYENGISIFVVASTTSGYTVKIVNKVAVEPPKIFRSVTTGDGWILESSETSNTGGTVNRGATVLYVGDDGQDRQYRSILSFNTTGLPDNAIITSAKVKIKIQGFTGDNIFTPVKTHGNLLMDIRKPYFGSTLDLATSDFQAGANKSSVGILASALSPGWYTVTLKTPSFPFINLVGTTQFRLRFTSDDNDDAGADYLKIFSGDSPTASRPQLIVEYYVP